MSELTQNIFTMPVLNIKDTNSCTNIMIKIGELYPFIDTDYVSKAVILELLETIISEDFFDTLRTKEQLGYVVSAYISVDGLCCSNKLTTFNFCVQSPNQTAQFLQDRIIKFIHETLIKLNNMDDISFKTLIDTSISQYAKPFQNLISEVSYQFDKLQLSNNDFNFKATKIAALQKINKSDIIEFYKKYFSLEPNTFYVQKMSQKVL
jgi:secreted Zn-dependent insulinase-like peptidase